MLSGPAMDTFEGSAQFSTSYAPCSTVPSGDFYTGRQRSIVATNQPKQQPNVFTNVINLRESPFATGLEQIFLFRALSLKLINYFKLESFGRSEIDCLFVEILLLISMEDQMKNERNTTESPPIKSVGEWWEMIKTINQVPSINQSIKFISLFFS